MIKVQFFGGYNYSPPQEEDVEEFSSIEAAAGEWRFRRDYGYWRKSSLGYYCPNWGDGIGTKDSAIYVVDYDQYYNYNGRKLP